MKYSSVGVSGLDVLFMSDSEREVFYQRIPLFTSKALDTIINTLKLNQQVIAGLNLRKDPTTDEFASAYSAMQQYKSRFFKNASQPRKAVGKISIPDFNADITSEFSDNSSDIFEDLDDMFEEIAESIESEQTPLEELEIFIRAGGTSSNLRDGLDARVVENNFASILSKYNRIPADVSSLPDTVPFNDPIAKNFIRSLSKRVYMTDGIVEQMKQENKNTLVDITIHGKVISTSRRVSIYKRFSERHKTRNEIKFTLTQIIRQLKNLSTDDMAYADTDSEFVALVNQYHSVDEDTGKDITIGHDILQLVPLFKVLKDVQGLEYKEIFGKYDPSHQEVIKFSKLMAVSCHLSGLIPGQEEILIQNIPALRLKPIAVPIPPETMFILEVLSMSLVSQKYGMVTGVRNR